MEGFLTVEEMEERIQAALSAKTRSDLAVLFTDLPSPPAVHPVGSSQHDAPDSLDEPKAYSQPVSAEPRKGESWFPSMLIICVALGLTIGTGGRAYMFLLFAIALVLMLAAKRSQRRQQLPAQHVGIPQLTYRQRDQITRLIRADRKIQAIKLYREFTNADLLVAKNTIDAWERELPGR